VHFVGEDNTIFHALTWPAMMMAEGSYQLPWQVVVNAFLNIKFPDREEEKVSKSRGTAIWIEDYLKEFDPDPLRYYLTAIAPEHQRATFDADDFFQRNNSELLNALGNFVNRTMTFAQRYYDSNVPDADERSGVDTNHLDLVRSQVDKVTDHLSKFEFKAGLSEVMALARAANGYFDTKEPWKQRKNDMAACGVTINVCLQTVRALATVMAPFLPFSAVKCMRMLNLPVEGDVVPWDQAMTELEAGHTLNDPEILFKKLEATDLLAG
jgi:methionyl-tRNA synthetase